jgi:hypothetical protein
MVAHEGIGVPPVSVDKDNVNSCVVDDEDNDNLPCKGGDNKPGNHADTCKREEWQA